MSIPDKSLSTVPGPWKTIIRHSCHCHHYPPIPFTCPQPPEQLCRYVKPTITKYLSSRPGTLSFLCFFFFLIIFPHGRFIFLLSQTDCIPGGGAVFCTPELVRIEASDTTKVDNLASALNFRQQSLLVIAGQIFPQGNLRCAGSVMKEETRERIWEFIF